MPQSIKDRFHEDWNSFVSGGLPTFFGSLFIILENIRAEEGMNQASADEYFRDEIEEQLIKKIRAA